MAFLQGTRKFLDSLAGLVLPPTCVVCDMPLAAEQNGICPDCWPHLRFWDGVDPPSPLLPAHIDSFQAPLLYLDQTRDLATGLKFADRTELARPMAQLMLNKLPHLAQGAVIMPVPMHKTRLRKRGFNQAGLLAQALARMANLRCDPFTLQRVKATPPQVGKTAAQRRRALVGAFKVSGRLDGVHVLLIDDVWTTGSTAATCASTLKRAGAARVDVLTFAYVPPGL